MTPFSDIYDLATVSFQDYHMNILAATPTNFENFMWGFLVKSIPRFSNCVKNLEDRNDTTQVFNINLDTDEKVILSNIMVYEWLQRQIADIRQISLSLTDTDFRHYAEQQNLRGKLELSNHLREIYTQSMTEYGLKHVDWASWATGVFT